MLAYLERLRRGGFNPRARGGRDFNDRRSATMQCPFQSTRPRGARRLTADKSSDLERVSIHAPAGGATRPPQIHEDMEENTLTLRTE